MYFSDIHIHIHITPNCIITISLYGTIFPKCPDTLYYHICLNVINLPRHYINYL